MNISAIEKNILTPDDEASRWSVAIFASREAASIVCETVLAVLAAISGRVATIDILINGKRELAVELARTIEESSFVIPETNRVRVWFIGVADKSYAWNAYLSMIAPDSDVVFFVDGYARVNRDAFSIIAADLAATPHALGASGVPTVGRSAKRLRAEMLRSGGVHGNLYAIRGSVLNELKSQAFRLPEGLYRTDPLLMAVLCFSLDPAEHEWDPTRIKVSDGASWTFRPLSWWSARDLRGHLKRIFRQAQGDLENLAIRDFLAISRKRPENLPRSACALVMEWAEKNPKSLRTAFLQKPLRWFAYRSLKSRFAGPERGVDVQPEEIFASRDS